MEIRYFKHYSSHLNRDMEFKVYGHAGKPVLFFPCQGGRFFDFENFGMDNRWRIENHERWFNYIVNELVPYIRHLSGERNGFDQPIMTFGCSMGAMHAANLFFRRPDLFDKVFAISGLYDSRDSFGDYMDDLIYANSPVNYLNDMPHDHYYIDMYNHRKILIVVGQGAWEGPLVASTAWLDSVLRNKGIRAQVDYWGHDVHHDWCWWFKMVEHYVPQLLG